MQLPLVEVSPPLQAASSHLEATASRLVRVSLGYVCPGKEDAVKSYVLRPSSVPEAVAQDALATISEGQQDLGKLASDLAAGMAQAGHMRVEPEELSDEHRRPAYAMHVRRKSFASLADKVRRYEGLTRAEIRNLGNNGCQPRFRLDGGHLLYEVADLYGIRLIVGDGLHDAGRLVHDHVDVDYTKDYVAHPKPQTDFRALKLVGRAKESGLAVEVQVMDAGMYARALRDGYAKDKDVHRRPSRGQMSFRW